MTTSVNSSPRLAAVAATLLICIGCGPNYNKIMTDKISRALGADYRDYDSFSYPTNNFGLSTAYTPMNGRTVPSDADFLCDMWDCIGVADEKIPTDPKALLSLNGFAAVGDNGGIITLTEKEQRNLALKVALPEIYKVANVSGGFQRAQVTQTTMSLGRAYPRKLRRKVMSDYLAKLPNTDRMKQAFVNGDLSLVVADVVIESMRVEIAVTASGKQSLDAALGPEAAGPAGKVLSNAKLTIKAGSTTDGKYTFEVSRPVIIKRLTKKQAAAGVLGDENDDDWKDWSRQTVPIPVS